MDLYMDMMDVLISAYHNQLRAEQPTPPFPVPSTYGSNYPVLSPPPSKYRNIKSNPTVTIKPSTISLAAPSQCKSS